MIVTKENYHATSNTQPYKKTGCMIVKLVNQTVMRIRYSPINREVYEMITPHDTMAVTNRYYKKHCCNTLGKYILKTMKPTNQKQSTQEHRD